VIESAEEFVRLRTSQTTEEYRRAAQEEAQVATWTEIIECFPEMRFSGVQNKSVPLRRRPVTLTFGTPRIVRAHSSHWKRITRPLVERRHP